MEDAKKEELKVSLENLECLKDQNIEIFFVGNENTTDMGDFYHYLLTCHKQIQEHSPFAIPRITNEILEKLMIVEDNSHPAVKYLETKTLEVQEFLALIKFVKVFQGHKFFIKKKIVQFMNFAAFCKDLSDIIYIPEFIDIEIFAKQLCLNMESCGKIMFIESSVPNDSLVILDPEWVSRGLLGLLYCTEELKGMVNDLSEDEAKEYTSMQSEIRKFEKFPGITKDNISMVTKSLDAVNESHDEAIFSILEKLRVCIPINVVDNDGVNSCSYFPTFMAGFASEGQSGVGHRDVTTSLKARYIGRRYYRKNLNKLFPPNIFPILFCKLISSFPKENITGCKVWKDCLKLEEYNSLALRIEIVEKSDKPFFDLTVMEYEHSEAHSQEMLDPAFQLLKKIDSIIFNLFLDEINEQLIKHTLHPTHLGDDIFGLNGQIQERSHKEFSLMDMSNFLIGSDCIDCLVRIEDTHDSEPTLYTIRKIDEDVEEIRKRFSQMETGLSLLSDRLREVSNKLLCHAQMIEDIRNGVYLIPLVPLFVPDVVDPNDRNATTKRRISSKFLQHFRLFFICPISLKVPFSREEGRGYLIEVPRKWLITYAPAVKYGMTVLGSILSIGAGILTGGLGSLAALPFVAFLKEFDIEVGDLEGMLKLGDDLIQESLDDLPEGINTENEKRKFFSGFFKRRFRSEDIAEDVSDHVEEKCQEHTDELFKKVEQHQETPIKMSEDKAERTINMLKGGKMDLSSDQDRKDFKEMMNFSYESLLFLMKEKDWNEFTGGPTETGLTKTVSSYDGTTAWILDDSDVVATFHAEGKECLIYNKVS